MHLKVACVNGWIEFVAVEEILKRQRELVNFQYKYAMVKDAIKWHTQCITKVKKIMQNAGAHSD